MDFVDLIQKLSLKKEFRVTSIIDINNGKQPISSDDGRFIIVYNGMIYNFEEIRNYLIEKKIIIVNIINPIA